MLPWSNSVVGKVWLGHSRQQPLPKHLPLLSPCLRIGDELLIGKIIGVKPAPNATGTAKVWNPGLSANAGTGEDHNLFSANNQVSYILGKGVKILSGQ
jgi:hypothetical protein